MTDEKSSKIENTDGKIGDSNRETRIMFTIANTNVIMMSAMMDIFGDLMIQTTGTMATGFATAIGGEGSGEEVKKEFDQKLPDVNEKMKTMISDIRDDLYTQFKQKREEMKPFLSDPIFDLGLKIIEKNDFGLHKLDEELDDKTLAKYAIMFASENPHFLGMF